MTALIMMPVIGPGTCPLVRIRRSLISVHLLVDLGSGVRFRVVPVCIVVTVGR
jgi:hypothetical protein